MPDTPPLTVRCFFALYLEAAAQAAVEADTAELRRAAERAGERAVRWAPPGTLHLTLRFLGDTPRATADALVPAVAARLGDLGTFTLRLAGAGAFPPRGRPRVLWVGVDPSPTLAALHAHVEDACDGAGLGREPRPFRPHLTVGRPRPGAPLDHAAVAAALARVGFVASARVDSFHLMASDLTAAGARHTPFHTFPLGRPPAAAGAG